MSAWKEISEIGKSIVKGSTIIVGTKRLASFADRAIPAAAGKGRQVWDRIKNTKSTGKKKVPEEAEESLFEETKEEPAVALRANKSMYDAEFEDKEGE